MFGKLPAYGLFCRHASGLCLSNVRLESDLPDGRHALVLEDVAESTIAGLVSSHSPGAAEPVRLTTCKQIAITGCHPQARGSAFALIEGKESLGIAIFGNDLSGVKTVSTFSQGAEEAALRSAANVAPA